MAVQAIDATVGGANSNSYATSAESTTYNEHNPTTFSGGTDVWGKASVDDKAIAIQHATMMLDFWVDWKGSKVSDEQALRWPRYSVKDQDGYVIASDSIPLFLVRATSELARIFLTDGGDGSGNPDTLGFSELKVGPLELKVDKSDRDKYGAIPDSVRVMIEPYGSIRSRTSPSSVMLMRT